MIVMVSGGFDPLHIGHLAYLKAAAEIGSVIVALNSDEWLFRKKGFVFMPWREREAILQALRCVHAVTPVNDGDGTVCEALTRLRPHVFANGGDRTAADRKEAEACERLEIGQVFGVGGPKIASSSEMVRRVI